MRPDVKCFGKFWLINWPNIQQPNSCKHLINNLCRGALKTSIVDMRLGSKYACLYCAFQERHNLENSINWGLCKQIYINPLSGNPIKWSNTLKQFVAKLSTNCLSVFDHFVRLAPKALKAIVTKLNVGILGTC